MLKAVLAMVLLLGMVGCKPDQPAKNSSQVDADKASQKDTELKTDGGASQVQSTNQSDNKQVYGEKQNRNASQDQKAKQ
jgi:hypothetical protein